jgi:hypothetical protein
MVYAFNPMAYTDFPAVVRKAQVQGVDYLRRNKSVSPFKPCPEPYIDILINPNVEMTTGKTAAQAAHALLGYVVKHCPDKSPGTLLVGVHWPSDFDDIEGLIEIHDAGFTEIPAGTLTAKIVANQNIT